MRQPARRSETLARRGPRHANPSVLAPTRSVAILGGLAALVGLGLAGCAVAAGGSEQPGAAALPVSPPAVARAHNATTQALPPAAGAARDAWFRQHSTGAPAAGPVSSSAPAGGAGPVSSLAARGIPTTALLAYKQAAAREAVRAPQCRLVWPLLAGIGRVESNHGRFAGAVLHRDGVSTPRIVGIPLDGNGTELIADTDHGRLDGDAVWDRAVGPMQFIPSTWAGWGVDANHDGAKDPNNLFDAAAAAGDYLCAAGRTLNTFAGQVAAVRSYNNSDEYISLVLSLERTYARGVVTVPTAPGNGDLGPIVRPRKPLPPVDPGPPAGAPAKPSPVRPAPGSSTPKPSPTVPSPVKTSPTSPPKSGSPTPTCPVGTLSAPTTGGSTTAPSSPPSTVTPSTGSPSTGTGTPSTGTSAPSCGSGVPTPSTTAPKSASASASTTAIGAP